MTVRERIKAWAGWAEKAALCAFRKWWRPATCVIAAGTVYVNGIHIPLKTGTGADLVGLAAVLAALAPFAIAREWGKAQGHINDDAS